MSYALLKSVHYALALVSISGFILRGAWKLMDSPLLENRVIRIVPHVIDTLFLVAGLALAHRIFQYPFIHDWLTAKFIGLLVYIVLGSIALRFGRSRQQRSIAFIGALIVFTWIISVAFSKSPWGFLIMVAS